KINRGILTGFNKAFIIDEEIRKRLIKEDPKSAEIIRPILRGKDIQRYNYKFEDLYLISTYPSLNIEIDNYPTVKSFLKGFKPKIKQTGEALTTQEIKSVIAHGKKFEIEMNANTLKKSRKKTNNKWFETQDSIDYWEDFDRQKIMYSEIVREPQFFLDNKGEFYPEATTFIITGNENLENLTFLLNSKLITYFFRKFYAGGGLGKKGIRYKKAFLE